MQYCDFSMDREEKAIFEILSVTCHLQGNISATSQGNLKNKSRVDLFMSAKTFCMVSKSQLDTEAVYVAKNIYRGHLGYNRSTLCRLKRKTHNSQ